MMSDPDGLGSRRPDPSFSPLLTICLLVLAKISYNRHRAFGRDPLLVNQVFFSFSSDGFAQARFFFFAPAAHRLSDAPQSSSP